MLAVKASMLNIESGTVIGQIGMSNTVVVEVDSTPSFEHEDITESSIKFTQRAFDGKFGIEMTYTELVHIRDLLDELGDYGREAGSLSELELRKEITDIQLALVEGG